MKNKKAAYLTAVSAVTAVLIGVSASIAMAAGEPVATVGSTGDYYLIDSNDGKTAAADSRIAWDTDLSGSPQAAGGFTATFQGPADATSVRTFISQRGAERSPTTWVAYADSAFKPGTKQVLMPSAQLSAQILGNAGTVKTTGGNYSLGFAFLKSNGVQIASDALYYTYITVTPGSGDWKFATPSGPVVVEPPVGAFTQNLQATTIASVEGTLNLVKPTSATSVIGNPTIVNQLSTSTGKLGEFRVEDSRVNSHKGWTLTTTVAEFVNQADNTVKIPNTQLGVKPVLVSTTATGVSVKSATIAGSAVYSAPFAEANDSAQVGSSVFDADLTFVAPAGKPAGVYTSTLTLSLVSK